MASHRPGSKADALSCRLIALSNEVGVPLVGASFKFDRQLDLEAKAVLSGLESLRKVIIGA